jgi:hypothetical protein
VLAELVMQVIDPPAPPLSCLESFYEAGSLIGDSEVIGLRNPLFPGSFRLVARIP